MDDFLRLMCVSSTASQHIWLAAAAAAEGTCASSDCRQLTVSLTSVFSKLYVISEAEEDGGVSRFHTTRLQQCSLSLGPLLLSPESLPESVDFKRLMPTFLRDLHTSCQYNKLLLFTSSILGLSLVTLLHRYSSENVAALKPSNFFITL